MMPKRTTCQVILFAVWFLGLIAAVSIYEIALIAIKSNHALLYSGPGLPDAGWLPPSDWERQLEAKYEGPLAAIYTPWLLVMVGAVLAGVQRSSSDRISGAIFATTLIISLLFNLVLCWLLWKFLFQFKPLDNEIPSKSPLIALLISIIGAFVTYNFPKVEDQETTQHVPPAEPPAAPTA